MINPVNPDDPRALIARLQSIASLDEDDIEELRLLCATVRHVDARQDIASDNERPEHVHLMLEGWAARYKVLPDGARQITAFLIPGDFCDLHVTVLARRDDGIVALTPCRFAVIGDAAIDRVTTEHSRVTRALWWTSLVDATVLREWVVNNGRRDAAQAIAHVLCEMHVRMQAVGLVTDDRFELPLTQEELGDATGMTAVHVNRILQRFRNEGLLEHRHKMLTILDVEGLRARGAFDPAYLHLRRRETARM